MKRHVKRHAVQQPLNQSYRLIPLTQGQNAIVDVKDFEWLSQYNWCAAWDASIESFYAIRTEHGRRKRNIKMHRVILGCKSGEQADHKNHNTLDNRRDNLRKCTLAQNCQNRRKRKDCKTFKGVWKYHKEKRWRAQLGGRIIGYFKSALEAAQAYDSEAKRIYGEFAHTNFNA